MEWNCAKCGLSATADDWLLLFSMGWREASNGERRCSICAKKDPSRARIAPPRPTPPLGFGSSSSGGAPR